MKTKKAVTKQDEMAALLTAAEMLSHWPLPRLRAELDRLTDQLNPAPGNGGMAKTLEALRFTSPGKISLFRETLPHMKGKDRTRLRRFYTFSTLAAALERRLAQRADR